MKILKDAGTHELLSLVGDLAKQTMIIEKAGRTCYQSKGEITPESSRKFIRMIMKRGHESVIEHGSGMTVYFSNVSRGFTHEMVRHRLASYSQESTRFVNESNLHFVMPPHRDAEEYPRDAEGKALASTPRVMVQIIEAYYRALLKAGWRQEDARQFLPIGIRAQIVVTANFREWRHIFDMRTSKFAHWEIRRVMGNLLTEVKPLLSPLFDDFELAGEDSNGLAYWRKGEDLVSFNSTEMELLRHALDGDMGTLVFDTAMSKREIREFKEKLQVA